MTGETRAEVVKRELSSKDGRRTYGLARRKAQYAVGSGHPDPAFDADDATQESFVLLLQDQTPCTGESTPSMVRVRAGSMGRRTAKRGKVLGRGVDDVAIEKASYRDPAVADSGTHWKREALRAMVREWFKESVSACTSAERAAVTKWFRDACPELRSWEREEATKKAAKRAFARLALQRIPGRIWDLNRELNPDDYPIEGRRRPLKFVRGG